MRLPRGAKVDVKTIQLNDKGGIKGDDRSPAIPARRLDELSRINPQVGLFGSGDPFTPGRLTMQHMVSVNPVEELVTQDIVRRPVDVFNLPVEVTDTDWLEEYNRMNRMRSRLENAKAQLEPLQRIIDKPGGRLEERGQRRYNDTLRSLSDEFEQEFTGLKDVTEELERVFQVMHEQAMPTTSEQMIQRFYVLPAKTPMSHQFDLMYATPNNCGLLMAGFDHLFKTAPYLGGRASSGCGGLFDLKYEVHVLDDSRTWRRDCVLSIAPDEGIEFADAKRSILYRCYEDWLAADFAQFDFSYDRAREILFAGAPNGRTKAENGSRAKSENGGRNGNGRRR